MIKLTDINGRPVYLAPAAIGQVMEAGASSQWHGIRAFVRTFEGKTLEVSETADQIARMMEEVTK